MTRSLLSVMDHQNSATSSTRSVDGVNGGRSVWQRVSRPEVVLAVGSPILLLVDIGLIIVFVLKENWQGVIYSGVVFLAWSQVIFWFFRTRTLLVAHRQIRSGTRDPEAADSPPPYEEVIKTEAPPPPYYMVVPEGGWSTSVPGCSSYTGKDSSSLKKGAPSGHSGHLSSAGRDCSGITAPYIHHITSDETTTSSTTSTQPPAYIDPVQVIRAPIVTSLPAPTHKPATREGSRTPDEGV